jgi:uncharacterized membrane protein HdeD (DUF308 family)
MQTYSPTQQAGQYWWLLLIWGILVGLFGLCALFWPHLTLFTLIFLFGVFALVNGALGIAIAMQERQIFACWWATLAAAVISVLIGLAVMTWPHVTALIILYLIAVWAVVTGIFQLTQALGKRSHQSPLFLSVTGVASVVLGILLMVVSPVVALLSLVWVIGLYALVCATVLIMRAFFYRAWSRSEESRSRAPEFLP